MLDEQLIEGLRSRASELEDLFSQPDITSDQKRFQSLLREHASLKKRLEQAEEYFSLVRTIRENREMIADEGTDSELREMAELELTGCEEQLPQAEKKLKVALLPEDPADGRGAILEVRAGTGGDEAGIFAGDLYRMYSRFAESRGWTLSLIDANSSSAGGYKEIVVQVEGDNVFRDLKFESGTHRVQRIPATESQGRIHTSAATVAVFPEIDEQDDIDVPANELRVDTFCASGPGGQHVNTTQSAVRITHIPTGIVAQSQENRSQHRNKEQALSVLKARLLDHQRQQEEAKMGADRRSKIGSGDRSERIRTYNFPQNRLTDHRINLTLYSLDQVIEGDLEELIAALADHDSEERLAAQLEAGGGA